MSTQHDEAPVRVPLVSRRTVHLDGPSTPLTGPVSLERVLDEAGEPEGIEVCRIGPERAECTVYRPGSAEFNAAEALLLYVEHPE